MPLDPSNRDDSSHYLGWVLYDAQCGMCVTLAGISRKRLASMGIGLLPAQTEWVREKHQLSSEEVQKQMYLVLKDGRVFVGAEAYRFCLKQKWFYYPVYLISVIPGLRQLFDWIYLKIAANREKISLVCGFNKNKQSF